MEEHAEEDSRDRQLGGTPWEEVEEIYKALSAAGKKEFILLAPALPKDARC